MQRASLASLAIVVLAVGGTGLAGGALADAAAADAEPEPPVEVEWCSTVIHDPMGMPNEVPYPCKASVNPPTATTAEPDVICWYAGEDPWGMPTLYPYPCVLDEL